MTSTKWSAQHPDNGTSSCICVNLFAGYPPVGCVLFPNLSASIMEKLSQTIFDGTIRNNILYYTNSKKSCVYFNDRLLKQFIFTTRYSVSTVCFPFNVDIPHDFNCHRFSHCLPTWMHVHSTPNNRWTNQLTIQDFYFDRVCERERDGKSKYSQTHRLFKLCNEVLSLIVNLFCVLCQFLWQISQTIEKMVWP